jgi:hypothetical protein
MRQFWAAIENHIADCRQYKFSSAGGHLATLLWKMNRLRTMAPAEIIWRVRRAVRVQLQRHGIGATPHLQIQSGSCGHAWTTELSSAFDVALYQQAADRILSGRFNVFALKDVPLGFPPCWNRDPKTGTEAPRQFGMTLDYRNTCIVGDIKYLWEINRHYELVTLAQASHLSREPQYAAACRCLLESWFEQAPYPFGPGWASSLENAIRLLNWAVAWHLLGGDGSALFKEQDGADFRQRWLDSICQHCHFIADHLSMHSSANNHLFGEYMGMFVGAVTWPFWRESGEWRQCAQRGLEQEAIKQNTPDGVNREQAVWYQHEVADMMLICGLFGKENGFTFSAQYWQRLESMLQFLVAVMDIGGNVPMLGDADDALMVRFSAEPDFHPYRSLLTTGAVLFGRHDFKPRDGGLDDKSRWLLGDRTAKELASLAPGQSSLSIPRAFPEGGYYVLGRDFGTPSEIKLVADAGPLGYLSIAAHGHADALAFTLSMGGQPVLIDPGTYAYHTQKKWRDYFRGTAAHNTVRIDGRDQSEPGGNFMWLRRANACCEKWDSNAAQDYFVGSHDGYMRLADPVRHWRKIVFDKQRHALVVEDSFECRGRHELEFNWHFAAACRVEMGQHKVCVSAGNAWLQMTLPDGDGAPVLALGQETPPRGWTSCRLDEKSPSPSISWKCRIDGATSLVTVFRIGIAAPASAGGIALEPYSESNC